MSKQIVNGNKIIVNGKKVGTVQADVFYKEITGSKHIMRTPHAIFFDVASLREVESYGAKFLHITDRENGNIYTAPLSELWQNAIYKNYGYGEQVGLAITRWTVKEHTASTAQTFTANLSFSEYEKRHPTKSEKLVGQLPLFEAVDNVR